MICAHDGWMRVILGVLAYIFCRFLCCWWVGGYVCCVIYFVRQGLTVV